MNTYFHKIREDKKDLIEAVIGDDKVADFMPQVKIKRFDNEYNFSIRYKHDGKGKESHEEKDGKFIWKKGKGEAHIYPIDGGYEIEAILNEKPKSNVVEFTLQTKGINFYYQPPLTYDEVKNGKKRPENVVGSYAVYSEKLKKTYKGGKEYGIGKICHIYRPRCIDSEGKDVWADLNINEDSGILSVIIPQYFLDTATYPVVVDPTIGYNSVGSSSLDCSTSIKAFCNTYNTVSAIAGDIVTEIKFYASKLAATESITMAMYAFSSGVPSSRLSSPVSVSVNSGTPQWWSSGVISQSLTAGIEYGPAFGDWGGTPPSNNTTIYFDDTSGYNSSYGDDRTLISTWTETNNFVSILSLYATFTRAPIDINYSYTIFIDKAKP